MDAGHGEIGLFDAFDIYDRARPFFRGRDAYSYASGFAAAMEGMGYRIEWCHDEGTTPWINAVTREEHDADGNLRTVGMTKEGDLLLDALRVRLVHMGDRFGDGLSYIYSLEDCRIHGGFLPMVEFRDMDAAAFRQHPAPAGRFLACYYADTLLNRSVSCWDTPLEAAVTPWELDAWQRRHVYDWLEQSLDAQGYDWRPHPMDGDRDFREPEDR
ncbi:hypothetical protein [uncultured Bifidobacterium sp.]|uniref:hypothetical protein n=1 Tax=uncultured Bifidobacterium sp. TaxID=165187 RepID=UPI002597AEBF|nr:hypothetical protein [uncultured Bifidobacterium sp.]